MNYLRLFTFVPERHVYVIERLGRFHKQLSPGFNWLTPFFDNVAYKHSLKEEAIKIEKQTAITQDNVSLNIDGVLFVKIFDPIKASYQVENPLEAVKLLALTLMRSEIGKLRLDKLFQERLELNKAINQGVNSAAEAWGIGCLRYEILNIDPPEDIKKSMQSEAEAERLKRKDILLSEAKKQSEINVAMGKNKSVILNAEADAESINIISEKEKDAINMISNAVAKGQDLGVLNYILLQNYLRDYENTIKKGKVTVAPGSGASGKEGSEMTTLAAMLLANQTRGGSQPVRNVEESGFAGRVGGKEAHPELYVDPAQDDYIQLAKKMKVYDSPLLYSSDEEALKKVNEANKQGRDVTQQTQTLGKM